MTGYAAYVCAVQRHGLSAGANPARQLSLQPVAIGAVVEVNEAAEASGVEGHEKWLGKYAGCNVSEH